MSGEVLIITRMTKIPKCCNACGYYDPMGGRGRYNMGACTAMGGWWSTENIRVSKERLPNCPLIQVTDLTSNQIQGRGMDGEI